MLRPQYRLSILLEIKGKRVGRQKKEEKKQYVKFEKRWSRLSIYPQKNDFISVHVPW